ncbi:DNA-binding response regulator [Halarcobacter mediterraneus]|uniref:DNA-binding response regulator n=1 Tax=Halarcobacter mediterraneus TaxID=2023153 RepID=A0A4Q1AWN7_9BACT|nr:response regulator [Halarcobacter mediterraneus]RXK13481.1 DNA-binding response regulator [Halarcobacter mediterraneus]
MKTKILIVEDEILVALDIKNSLIKFGFDVIGITVNYDETLSFIRKFTPDIILMDIHLENSKDGICIVEDMQKIKNIPVIYLTAYYDEKTVNRAIQTNPISYLLKPFNREELKSTIMLAMFKINRFNKFTVDKNCTPLGFDYFYDVCNEILFYKNMPIKLSLNERKLLTILVEAKGSVVSFREIEYLIWTDEPVSDGAIRTLVHRLRIKLEYKIIETIPTVGYKLSPLL